MIFVCGREGWARVHWNWIGWVSGDRHGRWEEPWRRIMIHSSHRPLAPARGTGGGRGGGDGSDDLNLMVALGSQTHTTTAPPTVLLLLAIPRSVSEEVSGSGEREGEGGTLMDRSAEPVQRALPVEFSPREVTLPVCSERVKAGGAWVVEVVSHALTAVSV
jgi:hypothetical protein